VRVINVTYIVRNLDGSGGIQYFAKNTSDSINRKNIQVNLLTWRSPLSLLQEILVRIMPKLISKKIYPTWFTQNIDDFLLEKDWDIIHFWHVKSAMALMDSMSLPYVLTCHGSEILRPFVPDYQYAKFINALKNASAIIANSRYTRDYLIKEYGINKEMISVINPGIDVRRFGSKKINANTTPKIGTLTRLIPRKNVINIIKALELLKTRGVDFNYYLAGTGSLVNRLKILTRLKRSRINWHYLGKISNEIKESEFYPSLDVFVLPPLEMPKDIEGFGIVFLEANASGVPVVAADTGGVGDAVKSGFSGLFADPRDPEDIAEKIYEVLKSRKNYEKTAKQWAENFSQEKTAKQFQAVYEKVKN